MNGRRDHRLSAILVASASAIIVAVVGGTLTRIGPWYENLHKPSWTPPDPAFGIIWTGIFALAAISGVTAWRGAKTDSAREWTIILFAANGTLNVCWSLLFFSLRRPDFALLEAGLLWLSVAALMLFIWSLSRVASLLLSPYLVWVGIAWVLNLEVVRMNRPFG